MSAVATAPSALAFASTEAANALSCSSPAVPSRVSQETHRFAATRRTWSPRNGRRYRDRVARQRKKRRASGRKRDALPSGMERVRPPNKGLRGLLRLLVDIPAAAERGLVSVKLPDDHGPQALVMFDVGILLRAINALKAIRVLCAEWHWEFAVATIRQLFELVINMEQLAAQPDREGAIFRYAKYGLLQTVRHQQLDLLYQQKTGREIDEQRLAVLEQMLEQTFPEFRSVGRTGHIHFARSWSGHDARYLAEHSRHPLRADQYDLLYASWSEQTHAAPAALLETMFPRGLSPERIIAGDLVRIVETITMAITLFLELWALLPHAPQPETSELHEWRTRMIDEARKLGAPIPPASEGPK